MRRCTVPTKVPDWLLSALDTCLDAMLSAASGARWERCDSASAAELEPLLSVASQLLQSREWIDRRLEVWQGRQPRIEYAATRAGVTAAQWPALN